MLLLIDRARASERANLFPDQQQVSNHQAHINKESAINFDCLLLAVFIALQIPGVLIDSSHFYCSGSMLGQLYYFTIVTSDQVPLEPNQVHKTAIKQLASQHVLETWPKRLFNSTDHLLVTLIISCAFKMREKKKQKHKTSSSFQLTSAFYSDFPESSSIILRLPL